MSLPKISQKRKATTRLRHNSTFGAKAPAKSVMTIAELRASGLLTKASELGKGKSDKAKAKARAWKWFSMFIRLRDSGPDGRGKCITCDHTAHWRNMDAGHYITRAKESTLFDERNVSLQCKGCNRFQGGKFFEHSQAIDRKFGEGTKAAIEAKASQPCRRDLTDYLFIESSYKARVDWIKQHEPTKFKP
jgi:hypothetical protein